MDLWYFMTVECIQYFLRGAFIMRTQRFYVDKSLPASLQLPFLGVVVSFEFNHGRIIKPKPINWIGSGVIFCEILTK